MSFGWAGSDVFLLAQLAWNTIQNTRKACGDYDELTGETLRLHAILQRLEQEVAKPDSPVNRPGDTSKKQLEHIASDCGNVLEQLDKIVAAYAALTEEKRSGRKIWQKVRFGNGQMADLSDLRLKMTRYTSEMLFYMNLVTMGTVGRIEQQMTKDGGVLNNIKIAVEKKTAHSVLSEANVEGSTMTSYNNDDTSFWRSLRRELVKEGLPSAAIHEHKHLIKAYVKELADRGVLDDGSPGKKDDQHDSDRNSDIREDPAPCIDTERVDDGSPGKKDDQHDSDRNSDIREDPAPCIDTERVECIICLSDDVPIIKMALLPCNHRWCKPCLRRIFTISTTDPQHMPPTCCTKGDIPLKHVENLFNDSFKRKWNRKYREYTTKNRIYCPASGCGSWIQPDHMYVNNGKKCGKCRDAGGKFAVSAT